MNTIARSLGIQGDIIDLNSSAVSTRVKDAIIRTMHGEGEPGDEQIIDGLSAKASSDMPKAILDENFFN